jgi:hypothetical protein
MAYRAVDQSVAQRVRHVLRRRHQIPTRGTRRYPSERIFGELGGAADAGIWGRLGLLRCDTRPRAGCGKPARPVR